MRRSTQLIAVAFAAGAAILLLAPAVARLAVRTALSSAGFETGGGSVSLGLHAGRIAALRLGRKGEATAGITYSLNSLLHGRVETVTISGTRLHGVLGLDGRIALDGYAPAGGSNVGGPVSLSADRATIHDLTLVLETPIGEVLATIAGEAVPADGGLQFTGTADVKRGEVTGTSPIDFRYTASGWTAALAAIRIDFPGGKADEAEGHVNLAKSGNAAVTGEGQIDGQQLSLAGILVRTVSTTFTVGADGFSASLKLVPADGGAGIDATAKSDKDGVTAKATAAIADIAPIAKAAGWPAVSGPVKASLSLGAPSARGPRPLALEIAYDGPAPGGVVLRAAKLKAAASYDGKANSLALTNCGAFSAEGVTVAGIALARVTGCLGPKDGSVFFAQDASGATTIAAGLSNVSGAVISGTATLAEIRLPSAQAAASLADSVLTGLDAKIDNASVSLPQLGAGISTLSGKIAAGSDGALSGALSGRFAAVTPNGPSLPVVGTVAGTTKAPGATLSVGAILKVSIANRTARIDMPPIEIGEGGADLLRLMPGLATSASKLSGSLAFHGEADWSGAKMKSKGSIAAKDVAATTPNFTVDGVDANIALPSLAPLTIAEKQTLTTKTLNVGLLLTDGRVVFSMNRNRILNIDSAQWSVAGGTVGTHDQQLDLYGPDQHFGIVVKDVDLAEVLKLVNLNGLSAEGTLVGAIPLRHTKDTILVQHGVLQTRSGGVIRYDPADTPSFLQGQPGQGTAILRDALKDFRYQQLAVTIDGVLGGDEQIKMSLKGANPNLYGGLPVSLNVNLSGALDSIARSSVEAYTRPTATIRKTLDKKTGEKK